MDPDYVWRQRCDWLGQLPVSCHRHTPRSECSRTNGHSSHRPVNLDRVFQKPTCSERNRPASVYQSHPDLWTDSHDRRPNRHRSKRRRNISEWPSASDPDQRGFERSDPSELGVQPSQRRSWYRYHVVGRRLFHRGRPASLTHGWCRHGCPACTSPPACVRRSHRLLRIEPEWNIERRTHPACEPVHTKNKRV